MRFSYFLLVTALILSSCKSENKQAMGPGAPGGRPSGPPPVFSGIIAENAPINRSIVAPGTILANETTNMQPEISGRVVSINFKEGTNVKSGALLVKLFDGDLQAQLKKLAVQLTIAEATEKRQKELLDIKGTSQQDFDNASLSVNNIKADMELLKVRISQTEVRAPFSGRLGFRNISLGAYVNPSTIITNISQLDVIKVEFAIPEKYAPEMLPNKILTLHTADQTNVYYATVIASQNLISAETRNLSVKAIVKKPDASLTPGTFVEVNIGLGYNANAIMVPTEAVIPSTRTKRIIVMREGKAVFQDINTGYRDATRVEIIGAISPGDTIITSGLLSIKDGMPCKVKIVKK